MTDVIAQDNKEKIIPQEVAAIQRQEQQQTKQNVPEQISQVNTETNVETQEDPNWHALRESRKKERAERQAAERKAAEKEAEAQALKAAMEALISKSSPSSQAYQQYYSMNGPNEGEETEDQRIEKKVNAAIAIREAAAEKARIERERADLPHRLRKQFPDYDQVVNEENGDYLEYHHPEVYRALLRQPETFESLSDVYNVVKKYIPNAKNAKKDAAKAEANLNKPKSISSTGITQPGEATQRSSMQDIEARRAARYAEMQRIMKGMG
jgi:hypothetical protein